VGRVRRNAGTLRDKLAARGFAVDPGVMPIVPLVIGDPAATLEACERALTRGAFAQAIRPPTVPPGTSRLRVTVSAAHTAQDLEAAARALGAAILQPV